MTQVKTCLMTHAINIKTFFKVISSGNLSSVPTNIFVSSLFMIMQTKHFYPLTMNLSSKMNRQIPIVFLIE